MKKIFAAILALIMSITFAFSIPAFADDCVQTAILGNNHEVCDNGDGSSITYVLNLVVDIMSVLIGILGVIGITITGIQYLTAGGSEEKTRKAKRRLFEIVIGLAVYAVMYALLSWLLPNN